MHIGLYIDIYIHNLLGVFHVNYIIYNDTVGPNRVEKLFDTLHLLFLYARVFSFILYS